MGFIRRAIERDQAAHAAFVAPPPYIENARQAREAAKRDRAQQTAREQSHQRAKFAAKEAKANAERAEREQRAQDEHTRRLAKAVVDEIVRRR
jgi:hypothetical protein